MARVPGALQATQETSMKFWAPGFNLTQPYCRPLGNRLLDADVSLTLSPVDEKKHFVEESLLGFLLRTILEQSEVGFQSRTIVWNPQLVHYVK